MSLLKTALRRRLPSWPALALTLTTAVAATAQAEAPTVGSKKFTESVILGEVARARLGALGGVTPEHRRELGGTQVLWKALLRGDIDVYPEYTGTLAAEVLHAPGLSHADIATRLAAQGVGMTAPLGFDNTYALGMREARAAALGISTISQLAAHPALQLGFTAEFMQRDDGYPGLRDHYGLAMEDVRGMDHDLAYRGLADGSLDVIDLYSTDAEIAYYDLAVLEDDRQYFPSYEAVYVYRTELPAAQVSQLRRLEGMIDAAAMRAMNARVKIERVPEAAVARDFLSEHALASANAVEDETWLSTLAHTTLAHLALVLLPLAAGIALSVPLGVLAARRRKLGQGVLAVTGVLQTIPSLALLVVLIPVLGIGAPPAIATLFLYSLLPIVRNTHAGLVNIDRRLLESADALGLTPRTRLKHVELPLALPSILAGIKTAAVINVGTATLGALVGAGGYGQPILSGIRLDDTGLILQGALPAAALALLLQGAFELLERRLTRRRA